MKKRYPLRQALVPFILFPLLLAAQPNGEEDEEDAQLAFELSPFQVDTTGDVGYLSTNSISGTSLNIAIRDLPMPLEVVNSEFMQDVQATDMKEALNYSAGVFTQTFRSQSGAVTSALSGGGNTAIPNDRSPSTVADVNNPFTNTISIRGYAVPNQQRMGFRVGAGAVGNNWDVVTGGFTDTSNVERLEVVRGPASLLYGINVLSGIVNIIPKQPLPERRTRISASAGSHGFRRASLDTTGPLIKDRLNYRLIATGEERDHWEMFRSDEKEYYVGQLDWTIHRRSKTSLFLEAQYGEMTSRGIGAKFFVDRPGSASTGLLTFRNQYFEPFSFGWDYTEEDARTPGTMLSNYLTPEVLENYTGTLDLPESIDPDRNRVPDGAFGREGPYDYWSSYRNNLKDENYRVSGPDTYFKRKEFDFLALLRSEPIENLNIEVGAYYTDVTEEIFNNRLIVSSDQEGPIIPHPDDAYTPTGRFTNQRLFHRNPEMDSLADPVGWGVIERFAVLNERANAGGGYVEVPKWASYWWYREPKDVETLQLRARVAYTYEADMFGGRIPARHTFAAGTQYIKDEIFLITSPGVTTGGAGMNYLYTPGKLDQDPVNFRSSVFDLTPIRYDPANDVVAFPGVPANIAASEVGGPVSERLHHLKLSGAYDISVWNRGAYGVYQGQFWGDRMTVIGGARRDAYQMREDPHLRLMDEVLNRGWDRSPDGVMTTYTGEHFGYGSGDVTYAPSLPYMLQETAGPITLQNLPASVRAQPELAERILLEHRLMRGDVSSGDLRLFTGNDAFTERQIQEFSFFNNESSGADLRGYLADAYRSANPGANESEVAAHVEGEFNSISSGTAMQDIGLGEQGLRRYGFAGTQKFDTYTGGISFRLTDDLSVYLVHSEGVFPNQGVRDGLDRTIDAEKTSSNEIGLKFDFFDRKISGTISAFQIKRENAIFYFANAPAPKRWVGEIEGQQLSEPNPFTFDPQWAKGNTDSTWFRAHGVNANGDPVVPNSPTEDGIPRYSYGLREHYLEQAWAQFHPEDIQVGTDGAVRVSIPDKPFTGAQFNKLRETYNLGFIDSSDGPTNNPTDPFVRDVYYYFNLEDITDADSIGSITPADLPRDRELPYQNLTPEAIAQLPADERARMSSELQSTYGNPILYALELAVRDQGSLDNPISTATDQRFLTHSMSRSGLGANVPYEEEAYGVDGQIIFSPTRSFQAIFNFSYQQREVVGGGFQMSPLIQNRTGDNLLDVLPYGDWMRYEAWVYQLGIWNFENPADPASFDGGSVNGIDLSMVPEWNLNLFGKYTFREGPFEGLGLGGGARYAASAPTAVAVGGDGFRENRFLTPPTEERYEFDLSLTYTRDIGGLEWRFGLFVQNLLDDTMDERVVTYDFTDSSGLPQSRTLRTRTFYAPRTWRFSVSTFF